ncbi:hypothetical protein MN608_11214 [Microdochium nivale]|nr:hypothetical protein MN608_11214 [Microdochium nivale]
MQCVLESTEDRVRKPQLEAIVPLPPPPPPPPPLLPLDLPRPITPPAGSTPPDVAHLGTFARLPTELRIQVLTVAFGRRKLHMDLRLVPRNWRPIIYDPVHQAHGRGSAPWSSNVPTIKPHDELEWRWYGCACHRQAPGYRNPRDPRYHHWPR